MAVQVAGKVSSTLRSHIMGSIVRVDLELELGVLDGLPEEARQFLHGTLGGNCAHLGDWSWYRVAPTIDPGGIPCIAFCHTGRPSRDTMLVWVYCAARARYELYFAPYGDPPAAGPIDVAHSVAHVLEYVASHGFEAAIEQSSRQ